MDTSKLQYVVGAAEENKPAYMRFYGNINEDSTRCFNDEFLWLQDYVKPSKIVISINSAGGSVLYGMGTFAIIQQCPIEVETIIEGIAASMASVLWAAGTRSYMRDYSILMIHNPFVKDSDSNDPDSQQIVNAFKQQIETVYRKRFGLSKEKVREIMDGKEGCDGTYMDAAAAVAAGIITADRILKTSKQVCTKVKNQIAGIEKADELQAIMVSINNEIEIDKPSDKAASILNRANITNHNNNMNEKLFSSVLAQLGMAEDTPLQTVLPRITALLNAEKELKTVQSQYDQLKIQKEGLDATLKNVNSELDKVKADLKKYKDAEEAQHNAAITQMVDDAVSAGKITEESKSKWVEMAKSNFEMVKATLDSIVGKDKISQKIADDPANIDAAQHGPSDAEKEMAKKVEDVVGKDFQFKKLD